MRPLNGAEGPSFAEGILYSSFGNSQSSRCRCKVKKEHLGQWSLLMSQVAGFSPSHICYNTPC